MTEKLAALLGFAMGALFWVWLTLRTLSDAERVTDEDESDDVQPVDPYLLFVIEHARPNG